MSRRARRRRRTQGHRLRSRVGTAIRDAVSEALPSMGRVPKARVNWGWCDEVAEGARARLKRLRITAIVVKDDNELRTTTHEIYGDGEWTHAWIWVEGRHYDAEALVGVRRWIELPHFRRWLAPLTESEKEDHQFPWGTVDIDPVLTHGDEQTMFFRSARFERAVGHSLFVERELHGWGETCDLMEIATNVL